MVSKFERHLTLPEVTILWSDVLNEVGQILGKVGFAEGWTLLLGTRPIDVWFFFLNVPFLDPKNDSIEANHKKLEKD